jgi:hypothetical protein
MSNNDQISEIDYSVEEGHVGKNPARVGSPGKAPATARLSGRPQTNIIFRVADAASATAIADALGPRDSNGVAAAAPAAVERASASGGQPLPGELKERFEGSLGTDLSAVRVHTGSESAEASKALGAKAFTTGNDVHMGAGNYNPVDPFGVHLLAHEVAHTVQQRGSSPSVQNKLEVSTPQDSAEREADQAADAMVEGRPVVAMTATVADTARKIFRDHDPSTGQLQGAGDEAQANAMKAPLSIDSASVSADMSDSQEIIGKIDKHTPVIKRMNKDSSYDHIEGQYAPLATNVATKANLSVFQDKLGVSSVDTASFAAQYRLSFADYQRLKAEASEVLAAAGVDSEDPMAQAGDAFEKTNLKMDTGQVGLQRFRAARNNLHTAGSKMNATMTKCRGAANSLQGAMYSAKAAAAAAKGKDAATKLAGIRAEIASTAAGVGKVVKLASAVAGLAGGGGKANALAAPSTSGGNVDIEAGRSGLRGKHTVHMQAEGQSKAAIMQALGADLAGLLGAGGADKAAEALVTAIGTYANQEKIAGLQNKITAAAAEESSFKAAGSASSMAGFQQTLAGAAAELKNLLTAFADAKRELSEASQALMAELNKGGKKGKNQAKGIMFVSDADRFLAQVENTIAVGDQQQDNLKKAAADRKNLRGTTSTLENEPDRKTQTYWECRHQKVPGRLWGTNDHYSIRKVRVEFRDDFGNPNQGGRGSVEGTGGAGDEVKRKLEVLKKAKTQVTQFRAKIQSSLGMGGPVMQA